LRYQLDGIDIPIGMFPTLVRKWHSFVTHDLIENGFYLNEHEKEAVALICKYHRGRLPLLSGNKAWRDTVFKPLEVAPLEDKMAFYERG